MDISTRITQWYAVEHIDEAHIVTLRDRRRRHYATHLPRTNHALGAEVNIAHLAGNDVEVLVEQGEIIACRVVQ